MQTTPYHKNIIDYYKETENAYKDSWDLDNSLAIHYGYWDDKVRSFSQSLLRMNEVMIEKASITKNDRVLDAGCGVGGSSIFIASQTGAEVTGITISERQCERAIVNAVRKGVRDKVNFRVMNYSATSFPDASFDVVWGCESICYADNKEQYIKEAWRLLKPGGRLIVADGFLTNEKNNDDPVIRQWLDGWQVNYLETPDRFQLYMKDAGFDKILNTDITREVSHSSGRLYRFYFLASAYIWWKRIISTRTPTALQVGNIRACKFQYLGLKKRLWTYNIITGTKPL